MAKRKTTAALADVPFYDYLWQFYSQNRKKVRTLYTSLTKKFLDFNDPSEKGSQTFLRQPQFEALEMYVFLKEYCDNARLVDVFRDWYKRQGPFEDRGEFHLKIGELDLFSSLDAKNFEAAFSRLQASAAIYPNYIYALTMGLGKTILMATCIFYEFLLAKKYPKEARYCHNALVFAPDKTVLQSLKEIQTFDKSKVVPPEYVAWLDANLKFQFLDDTSISLQILEKSEYNIVISNNQKIILKRSHKEKTAVDSLFAAETKYEAPKPAATDPFAGLDDLTDGIETEDDLIANQRFEMLKRLTNLGIYVDEAHHAFGKALEKDFTDSEKATSLRTTINQLAAHLQAAGTRVVACYNYTGTPYVNNVLLPEVVYTYSLKNAIDHAYLKQADVKGYTNTKCAAFLEISIRDFWEKYGERRAEGMLPKMAIFASDIAELTEDVRPVVEAVLAKLKIPTDKILVNVGDAKMTTNDDEREFIRLDSAASEKQFILLVNKGREGWNCRSLFAVALHRTPKSKVFVLQATMRCLRAIGDHQLTGTVYLSEENRAILSEELQNNFRINIDEFTGSGEKGKIQVRVKMVPPPVTVKLKRIRKHYELKELNLSGAVDFRLRDIDPVKYAIVETKVELERVGREMGQKKVMESGFDRVEYTPLTLTAEVARYLGKSCLAVDRALSECKEGMEGVVAAVNKYNALLYDNVIPVLFRKFYDLEEKTTTENIELKLVKPPKDPTDPKGGGKKCDPSDIADFWVKPELLAKRGVGVFAKFEDKSFHLDNYCFDSVPEFDFFKTALKDEDIIRLYFTGMLTSDKTEFAVSYIDPESNTLRSYYPDFLAQKKDGSYIIIEVKGENKIDDAIVKAKARSASALAQASAMEYRMIPSLKAAYGLRQPDFGTLVGPEVRREIAADEAFSHFLPLYSFAAACGKFGAQQAVEQSGWIDVSAAGLRRKLTQNMFVVRAKGRSMEPKIHDGEYCVFEWRAGTCDSNDIVLAEHSDIQDDECEGAFSIKKFVGEKTQRESSETGEWQTATLVPMNSSYRKISLRNEGEFVHDYKIVGVYIGKL